MHDQERFLACFDLSYAKPSAISLGHRTRTCMQWFGVRIVLTIHPSARQEAAGHEAAGPLQLTQKQEPARCLARSQSCNQPRPVIDCEADKHASTDPKTHYQDEVNFSSINQWLRAVKSTGRAT